MSVAVRTAAKHFTPHNSAPRENGDASSFNRDRAVGGLAGLYAGSLHFSLADLFGFRAPLAFAANVLQFFIGEVLDANKGIMRGTDANEPR
jgi:hypothetical protein